MLILTWNIYAYNTDDWQNFYYPNKNYLKALPTGVPRTFPILVCIDPNINARRTQLIKQGIDIWNKVYLPTVKDIEILLNLHIDLE